MQLFKGFACFWQEQNCRAGSQWPCRNEHFYKEHRKVPVKFCSSSSYGAAELCLQGKELTWSSAVRNGGKEGFSPPQACWIWCFSFLSFSSVTRDEQMNISFLNLALHQGTCKGLF